MEPPFYPLPQDPDWVLPEPTEVLQRIAEPLVTIEGDSVVMKVDPTVLWRDIVESKDA